MTLTPDEDGLVRLQKLLATSGVASRRKCEELMLAGEVEVDGEVVTRLGTKVDPATAVIRVSGLRLPPASPNVYLALNKPRGVVSTMSDPEGRRTLGDMVEDRPERLFHVGRLDTDTAGLIILTNDGDFAQRLAHPSYEVDKTYIAEVTGEVTKATLKRLLDGVTLDDGPVDVKRNRIVQHGTGKTIVELVIHEGRNKIVRRLLEHVGHPVTRLTRTRVGPVKLGQLKSGDLRELTNDELGALLDRADLRRPELALVDVAAVPSVLAPYVTSLMAYDVDLGDPGVHRGLPSTSLTFVLPLDEPLDVGWGDGTARSTRWSTVSGLHAAPAAIHHDGHQRGVQLALTTAGARALLGLPARELAGEMVDLDEAVPELADLPERLIGLEPDEARRVVVRALVAALARNGAAEPRAEVGRALARLTSGGSVAAVADEVGLSRRRLTTLVREETGLGSKEYQRLSRFEASRGLLGHRPLAEVAAECGYADQAHLAREWAELAGCSPTTWLREEFPFLQDPEQPDASG